MRKHVLLYLMITLALTFTAQARSDHSDDIHRIEDSAQIFQEIMQTPDKAIPQYLLDSAQCIAIIPSEMRLAFIVGANYGKGLVTCRGTKSWSAPVFLSISGGSFGFQIGGSSTDLIMLVMNEHGAKKLLESKFTLGAEGSVAAGPVGRTATAQTDAQMHADILSWSRSQGLFAGLALEGATLRQDLDDNAILYGKKLENRQIVTSGIRPPKAAGKLMTLLNKYSFRD